MSILPNILEVVIKYNIKHKQSGVRTAEYYAICPFCNDKGYTFQFNTEKNTFICNRANHCGKRGGVIELITLLSCETKEQVVERLRKQKGLGERKALKYFHPAMAIPIVTLKEMGFVVKNLNWYESFKKDPEHARRELNWIWHEYKEYCKKVEIRRRAILKLFDYLVTLKGMDKLIECLTR